MLSSMSLETTNVQKHQFTSLKGTKEMAGGTEPEVENCRAPVAAAQHVGELTGLVGREFTDESLDHRSRKKTTKG